VECESKIDTSNNRGDWNHLKITETVPEQQNRKAQNLGTAKNGHTGHGTQTVGSADVKYRTYFTGKITLHAARIVDTEQLQQCTITVNTVNRGDNNNNNNKCNCLHVLNLLSLALSLSQNFYRAKDA